MTGEPLDDKALRQVFTEARTFNAWLNKPVSDAHLKAISDLMKMGPTSANCLPARIVFVKSAEAKARLKPFLGGGNVEKTMAAPVTAIIAYDLDFIDKLPTLFPHADARSWFAGNDALIQATAFRNSTLQGAYLMLAARMLGLDCGPMSGFDQAGVDAAFFPGGRIKSNFLCNIGYGDASRDLFPRSPKPDFDAFASII
ncbi:MAG: malonic semialdehyde reductase [Hyphomicrobiales bacterium]